MAKQNGNTRSGINPPGPIEQSQHSPSQTAEAVYHFAVDKPWARFDESIQAAAGHGEIANAEPLIRQLNSNMRVFQGLRALLEIVQNNGILEDQFDEEDACSNRPLTPNTIGSLLGLASEICAAKSDDICCLADWTEKHIESREAR